jgi:hypothetical protein
MGVFRAASLAAVLAVAGWTTAAGVAGADPQGQGPAPGPAPSTSTAAPAAGAAAAGPKNTIDTDGTFTVGTDIVPGNYASAGPVDGGVCYWKRTANADNGGKTIDNAMTKKPQVVQIDATDGSFKTDGCLPWSLTDQAPPAPGPTGLLGGLQLAQIMGDLNNRAGQAPPSPDPAPAPAPGPTP